jgi:hypothetical protein
MIKEIGQLKNDRTKCKSNNQTAFMPLTNFFGTFGQPATLLEKPFLDLNNLLVF